MVGENIEVYIYGISIWHSYDAVDQIWSLVWYIITNYVIVPYFRGYPAENSHHRIPTTSMVDAEPITGNDLSTEEDKELGRNKWFDNYFEYITGIAMCKTLMIHFCSFVHW